MEHGLPASRLELLVLSWRLSLPWHVQVEKGPTTAEEQEKFLADGLNVVKQQCFFMKRSLV